jgi:hypothetical protein
MSSSGIDWTENTVSLVRAAVSLSCPSGTYEGGSETDSADYPDSADQLQDLWGELRNDSAQTRTAVAVNQKNFRSFRRIREIRRIVVRAFVVP